MIKRKGQIVPRYLIPTLCRRHGHLVTFGCDVDICGRVITPISRLDPAVVVVKPYHWENNRHSRHARKERVTATWPLSTEIRVRPSTRRSGISVTIGPVQ